MRLIKQVLVTSSRSYHVANVKYTISSTRVPLANKLGMMVTYLDRLLPITSYDPLISWFCKITCHTKTISITTVLTTTKLGRMVTLQRYDVTWGEALIKLYDNTNTFSWEFTWQTKKISTIKMYMAAKHYRMVTNLEGLLPMVLLDPLITWSCGITWQTKTIFPLPQCLWPQNLIRWWLSSSVFYLFSHITI